MNIYTKKHTQAHSYNHIKYIIEYWYLWNGTITRLTFFPSYLYIRSTSLFIDPCFVRHRVIELSYICEHEKKNFRWKWLSNSIWFWSLPLQKNTNAQALVS